ncbi:MAG: stilbene synthase [Verrucomicrobia bacterium]|nr:stilbene synthase [Verrucomicrobiota bacterium]
MFLHSIGTAVPTRAFTQAEVFTALRHLALERVEDAFVFEPDSMMARFRQHAPALAEAAARQTLEKSKLKISDIDALLVTTCTGYLCPGLTSYLSESLGLPSSIPFLDLVGLGCGAALPALQQASALVASGQARHALVVCVEICSAASYLDDDPGVLISACLFGDGAAAAILSAEAPHSTRKIRWLRATSHLAPEHREFLRFDHRGGLLRNLLAPEVPALAARHARTVFNRAGLKEKDITGWIWHAGGRDVLRALRDEFSLKESDTRHSTEVLRCHGNMSSPSCLFALRSTLENVVPDGKWWLASFGAGFSSHGALLEVSS